MKRGLFCVFEGIDGSGKSTLSRTVHEVCSAEPGDLYSRCVLLREPTDMPTGRLIREKLAAREQPTPEEWLELFLRDREDNVRENVLPLREAGVLILQDRYFYSTAAYQGDENGPLSADRILARNRECAFPEPDLLFYLDLAPEAALERIRNSREQTETFEKIETLRRIYANYRRILPEGTVRLDASQDPARLAETVRERIRAALSGNDKEASA